MVKVMEIRINYDLCYKNNFKTNVGEAVRFYMNLGIDYKYNIEDFGGFVLYPQALNPFLKIMETMGESRNIIILPGFNNDNEDKVNSPAYIIIKVNNELSGYVKKLLLEK